MTIERPMFPPTRRTALCVIAGAAVAGPIAPAIAVDAVFELIEAHRAAHAAHMFAMAEHNRLEQAGIRGAWRVSAKPCDDENEAFEALTAAPATSLEGALAKLAYFRQLASDDETTWMIDDRMHASAFIESFAESLKNAGVL